MLDHVMNANYSAADCAFALQMQRQNFATFRRDLTRNGLLYFPRKTSAGPGGGEYRYAHVFEMGIHLAIGAYRKSPIARQVVAGIDSVLGGNGYATRKVNDLPNEKRIEFLNGRSRFEADDYPKDPSTGAVSVPMDNFRMVDFPSYYLDEDFISRDASNPTFAIYDPTPRKEKITTEVELVGNMSLVDLQERVIKLRSQNGDDRWRRIVEEDSDDLPVINLTSMLNRIDRRLALRLEASTIEDKD